MAYEKKEGDFTIAKNTKQREGSKDPDAQIAVWYGGKTHYIGIWNKTNQTDGSRFGSGSMFKFMQEVMGDAPQPASQAPAPVRPVGATAPPDNDLPF